MLFLQGLSSNQTINNFFFVSIYKNYYKRMLNLIIYLIVRPEYPPFTYTNFMNTQKKRNIKIYQPHKYI